MNTPRATASAVKQRHTSQFVGFELAGQAYAFRIDQIQEIVILQQITKTPQVPEFIEGVANLRGAIIPIVNLRKLFGLPARETDADTRTIVVNVGERTMGCTVDLVSQVIRIPEENIQAAPETVTGNGARYISGFARVAGKLLILLDIDELLDPRKLEAVNLAGAPEAS